MLKRGSTGSEVESLQKRLRELGFDADGVFGPATHAAVVAYQTSRGLLPDGLVGPQTQAALDDDATAVDTPPDAAPPIDRNLRLSRGNYVEEATSKDLIVMHHTVGGSARSTIGWWESQANRVATAYVIERDGHIHEVFDPRFWAYHLGVRGMPSMDRRSIGIELASEGPLEKTATGYRAFGRAFTGAVYDHGSTWRRTARYFAAYTPEQLEAASKVVDHLSALFGIPRKMPANTTDFDAALYHFKGVIGHHHVRADKTDVHPGFDWDGLSEAANLNVA